MQSTMLNYLRSIHTPLSFVPTKLRVSDRRRHAGANISAVLSHLVRYEKLGPLTGVALGLPVVVHHDAVPEKHLPTTNCTSKTKMHRYCHVKA